MSRSRSQGGKSDRPGARLEAELSDALGRLQSPRNRKLVARHLGWDGRPPCSLKEAGSGFHLTRERARQVFAAALPLLRLSTELPALEEALALVQQRQHQRADDVEQELRARGLTNGRVSLHGILSAARVFERKPDFELHLVGGFWFVGAVAQAGKLVLDLAVRAVLHHGAARVSDLRRQAGPRIVDQSLVRRILQTRSDLCWLDAEREWFWLRFVARNRLLTRVRKVLAVCPRIQISSLHQAISRDYKPVEIPQAVLRSLCQDFSWCRVGSQYVEARLAPNLEDLLAGGEAVVCAILRQHGGALPLPRLRPLCFAAGVKKPNLWRVLSFSPLLQRFDKEIYGLVGARPGG